MNIPSSLMVTYSEGQVFLEFRDHNPADSGVSFDGDVFTSFSTYTTPERTPFQVVMESDLERSAYRSLMGFIGYDSRLHDNYLNWGKTYLQSFVPEGSFTLKRQEGQLVTQHSSATGGRVWGRHEQAFDIYRGYRADKEHCGLILSVNADLPMTLAFITRERCGGMKTFTGSTLLGLKGSKK